MTYPQLVALAEKHGFEIGIRGDQPTLKPIREGAVLPGPVRHTIQKYRQVILYWIRRQNRPEWEKCRVCLRTVHKDFEPLEVDNDECLVGYWSLNPRCPYRPPTERPDPPEPDVPMEYQAPEL
jgi:hypothetical protein